MSIQLVNPNKKTYNSDIPTCQTHCELFDQTTEKCGFFNNEVPHDPLYTAGCSQFLDKEEWEEHSKKVMEEKKFIYHYPDEPKFSIRKDAVWYISSDRTFGCWIISLSNKNRLMTIDNANCKIGWHEEIYRSPYPLHDHGCEPEFAIIVAWVIDKEGYGQYAYVTDEELTLFHPQK